MIFDTDILIWVQRGNLKAAKMIDQSEERFISIQTHMELLQSAKNKKMHEYVRDFLTEYRFIVLPFTENIGHRALIYIEEYTVSNGLRSGDAIIAATAVENNLSLLSSNAKHLKIIKDLSLAVFKP